MKIAYKPTRSETYLRVNYFNNEISSANQFFNSPLLIIIPLYSTKVTIQSTDIAYYFFTAFYKIIPFHRLDLLNFKFSVHQFGEESVTGFGEKIDLMCNSSC